MGRGRTRSVARVSGWQGSTRRDRLPKNWQAIRRAVLERDYYSCLICGRPANQVDHVQPGDNHHPSNLQSLCPTHHTLKSSSEGGHARAKAMGSARREPEQHPGER